MRDGEVLVLDEPTASLDTEREYAIFQRFRELTTGKIAVLISHRFSTVRMADRIAVIEGGALRRSDRTLNCCSAAEPMPACLRCRRKGTVDHGRTR